MKKFSLIVISVSLVCVINAGKTRGRKPLLAKMLTARAQLRVLLSEMQKKENDFEHAQNQKHEEVAAIREYYRTRDALLRKRDEKMFIWARHTSFSGYVDIKKEVWELYDKLRDLNAATREKFERRGWDCSLFNDPEVLTDDKVAEKFRHLRIPNWVATPKPDLASMCAHPK